MEENGLKIISNPAVESEMLKVARINTAFHDTAKQFARSRGKKQEA